MNIKQIETFYNGYRFRSRLEARWAVFFDAIHMQYRYEYSGYDLGGIAYLPDFQFTYPSKLMQGSYAIQRTEFAEIKPTAPTRYEWNKAVLLCYGLERDVHIFSGEIGNATRIWTLVFLDAYLPEFLSGPRLNAPDTTHAMPPYICCYSLWAQCRFCGRIQISRRWMHVHIDEVEQVCDFCGHEGIKILNTESEDLLTAFAKARSARFEHGETPNAQGN